MTDRQNDRKIEWQIDSSLSVYMSLSFSFCCFINRSFGLLTVLSIILSLCLSFYLSINQSIALTFVLSVILSINVLFCLSFCCSVYHAIIQSVILGVNRCSERLKSDRGFYDISSGDVRMGEDLSWRKGEEGAGMRQARWSAVSCFCLLLICVKEDQLCYDIKVETTLSSVADRQDLLPNRTTNAQGGETLLHCDWRRIYLFIYLFYLYLKTCLFYLLYPLNGRGPRNISIAL